ncbi:Dyp family peroxidase family protein [Limosilactobacillus frumenti DSM 13145]|uniref:Dyp family peroxidase family protein n=1 Tax=Limosilactobacillus frumenti DSM 13145 TaxID=1423746 RepID=A0A0R1P643_9LACO|nr:Dyp-type peroxidase [Limosilactobacillus frumenti]KRL28023.1 Dyp family peroxidase family protein [Limosilactobacillus frumenti DSM 13145]MBA2913484.1 Dyp-type peroxidase [Limosilactobacillus frumenti]QFG73149.1 Dyp-type peroxidase [Limosilactobacillus frumenti]
MSMNPNKAQDVWKDAGEHVQFTVLELKRQDQQKEQEAIQEFVDRFQAITRSLRIRDNKGNLKVALGFSNDAWDYLFPNAPKPKELETYQTLTGPKYQMPATEGDLFLHIRANDEAAVYELMSQVMLFLRDFTTVVDETKGFRYFEGRAIIGFIDGTENPQVEDAADYAIIGDEDPFFENGSYAFAQKWRHNMDIWNKLTTETQEKAVGRKKFSDLELEDGEKFSNAHNVASQAKINGVEQKIVRMNVPYSDPASGNTGTYFIGYSRYWKVTKTMLQNMLDKGDYLLSFSDILSGQLFFIPSRPLLDKIADGELN